MEDFGARTLDAYIANAALPKALTSVRDGSPLRLSAAHTAPVYVAVGESRRHRSPELARQWLQRLDDLEERLASPQLEQLATPAWIPYADGVTLEHLRRHRPALLQAIEQARGYYRAIAEQVK